MANKSLRELTTEEIVKVMKTLFECRDGRMLREEFEAVLKRIAEDEGYETIIIQARFEHEGMRNKTKFDSRQSKQDVFSYKSD